MSCFNDQVNECIVITVFVNGHHGLLNEEWVYKKTEILYIKIRKCCRKKIHAFSTVDTVSPCRGVILIGKRSNKIDE